jgi:hypothetical protein
MTQPAPQDCPHSNRVATAYCGSYFVKCAACGSTLITIPWFSAGPLLKGQLAVVRMESPNRDKVAEGPAEQLCPHIPEMLTHNERLELVGEHAVIPLSSLGDIKNNPLEVQKAYFSKLVDESPRDETLVFALAQVLREMGDDAAAVQRYDEGVAVANQNRFRRFPLYALPSLVAAAALWYFSFAPWLAVLVGLVGPTVWFLIYRNRQRWLPIVGFSQRAKIAARVDMVAALARAPK